MVVGIPEALLFLKYRHFAETFFSELGAEIAVSPHTNKNILDAGVKACVDDACLPVKVFHGHTSWLRDRCDFLLAPRILHIVKNEYICPMFCGLPDMLKESFPGLSIIDWPYDTNKGGIKKWALEAAKTIGADKRRVKTALSAALSRSAEKVNSADCDVKLALIGHMYNIYDSFINMDIIKKLGSLGIGVITADEVQKEYVDKEAGALNKRFWHFAVQYYGASLYLYKAGLIDGVIYLSAFCCGIDSVIAEMTRDALGDFPFMILKIDEHTGEAGFNTRIEAFADMLKWRKADGYNSSEDGQYVPCGESAF